MHPEIRVTVADENGCFFGAGPYALLRGIEKRGSLRMAAQDMEMSYSKALRMMHRAEEGLGCALTRRVIGGHHGGGSTLTAEALRLLRCYEFFVESCNKYAEASFDRFFADILREEKRTGE